MRLNRLGAKIIAVFGLVGLALIALAVDRRSRARSSSGSIGGAYVLAALIAVWIAIRRAAAGRHQRWLAANGLRGRATIVAASTGMSINEQPLIDAVVDLEVPGQAPRRVERTADRRQLRRPPDASPGWCCRCTSTRRTPTDMLIVW